jgi:hypothetical protein
MSGILSKLLKLFRVRRGMDMPFMYRHLLSKRCEASQTALEQEIIIAYLVLSLPLAIGDVGSQHGALLAVANSSNLQDTELPLQIGCGLQSKGVCDWGMTNAQ